MPRLLRTFVVANPTSGSSAVQREWGRVERRLKSALDEYNVAFTEGPGHATLLTREALRAGWEMVVAVGGDGTLNEVLNGFFEPIDAEQTYERRDGWVIRKADTLTPINPDATLGIIPMGTGGDFRRTLGMMGSWSESVDRLHGDETRAIDFGQLGYVNHQGALEGRLFINIASAGLSGRVDERTNKSWKGLGGTVSFAQSSLLAFATWRNVQVDMRLDEVEEINQSLLNCVVANGQYFGGGMRIAPGADVADGVFQLVVQGDFNKLEALPQLLQVYSGRHLAASKVWNRNIRSLWVKPAQGTRDAVLLDVDGEQPGKLPACWDMHPQRLRLKI